MKSIKPKSTRANYIINIDPSDISHKDFLNRLKRQLKMEVGPGEIIRLGGDPYLNVRDKKLIRKIIKAVKDSGNHVEILTMGDGSRDFDLLDSEDWYGTAIPCDDEMMKTVNPLALPTWKRIRILEQAKIEGIRLWLSFDPVFDPRVVLHSIKWCPYVIGADRIEIGKLACNVPDIDWAEFGWEAEELCKSLGLDYYIKDSLRAEMEKA